MMMDEPPGQSKIKIYGPPIEQALKELEKVAEKIPSISQSSIARGMIPSGRVIMGDYDFVFHWAKTPDENQIRQLVAKIDNALIELDCRYTITTVTASSNPYKDPHGFERT